MDLYDIVEKINGPIYPLGDSVLDRDRYENLRAMTSLVDKLLFDIRAVSEHRNSHEASVKKIADYAAKFMSEVADEMESE